MTGSNLKGMVTGLRDEARVLNNKELSRIVRALNLRVERLWDCVERLISEGEDQATTGDQDPLPPLRKGSVMPKRIQTHLFAPPTPIAEGKRDA